MKNIPGRPALCLSYYKLTVFVDVSGTVESSKPHAKRFAQLALPQVLRGQPVNPLRLGTSHQRFDRNTVIRLKQTAG
jgi:hypothetical protein